MIFGKLVNKWRYIVSMYFQVSLYLKNVKRGKKCRMEGFVNFIKSSQKRLVSRSVASFFTTMFSHSCLTDDSSCSAVVAFSFPWCSKCFQVCRKASSASCTVFRPVTPLSSLTLHCIIRRICIHLILQKMHKHFYICSFVKLANITWFRVHRTDEIHVWDACQSIHSMCTEDNTLTLKDESNFFIECCVPLPFCLSPPSLILFSFPFYSLM